MSFLFIGNGRRRLSIPFVYLLLLLVLQSTAYAKSIRNSADSLTSLFLGEAQRRVLNDFYLPVHQQQRDSYRDHLWTDRQSVTPSFSAPSETSILVSQINATEGAQCTWIFTPQENTTIDDYTIVPVVGNEQVLQTSAVELVVIENTVAIGDIPTYNVTAVFLANQTVGVSSLGLSALNKTTSVVEATSLTAQVIVIGITFFREVEGDITFYGGANRPLALNAGDLISDKNVNLQVLIQYVDGSNSTTGLKLPLNGVALTTASLQSQITYSAACGALSGTYDGVDVQLESGCGMGFSGNNVDGEYVGPMFGFDFNRYYNGSFTVFYEYDELLTGSDLEGEGYETFLQVSISGEVPPLVHSIEPIGPLRAYSSETVQVNLGNVPTTEEEAKLWLYELSIDFGPEKKAASFQSDSIVIHGNSTISGTFVVPDGLGTDLPWQLTITKPTGEKISAVDLTKPPYLFSFELIVSIDTISPSSGPEAGGTVVTLTGDFPLFENGINVTIDGTLVDQDLISAVNRNSITLTTPAKPTTSSFKVPIAVIIDGKGSNSVSFTYEPAVRIDLISPESGPIEGGTSVTLSGQFIDFDPASSDTGIYFGSTIINSTLIQSFNSTTILFNTPSRAELNPADLQYSFNVTVKIDGETSNSKEFSYEAEVIINSVAPSAADEAGGSEHVLDGQFINFDPVNSFIVIGGRIVEESAILSYNETTVQFNAPARADVGLAYRFKLWVTVGELKSNEVDFTYLETTPSVTIDGEEGTIDGETGNYLLGRCSNAIFRARVSVGTQSQVISYKWTLAEDGSTTDIIPDDVTTSSNIMLIPYTIIPTQNKVYILSVTITTARGTYTKSIRIVQRTVQALNIQIIDPRARSLSDPNVTLTIPSVIRVPGCQAVTDALTIVKTTAITYVWKFRGESYTFSYLNTSAPEDQITPTLLGREFSIPQDFMEYGSFALELTAFYTNQTNISGSDSTTVVIEPASLVAQINGGESSQHISETQDFAISAANSYDPDVLTGDDTAGLSYTWSCRYGFDSEFSFSETCGSQLMPSESNSSVSFTISSDDLVSVQNTTSELYIEYSLQVSKVSQNATGDDLYRVSDVVSSILILSKEKGRLYESLASILVVNNQSVSIDRMAVKYYEDLVITPVSTTTETTWTFRVVSPLTQARTLISTDSNLLTYPGYYVAGQIDAGRHSLGLKANVLSPNTEYEFLISSFRTGYEINEQVFKLSTVEEPSVTIGELLRSTGTTNDTFYLTATTSYDGDFKYFFLLSDDYGFETCVGGCQGVSFVEFRLGTAGNYSVRCDVYDYLGYTKLATTNGTNIVVTSESLISANLSVFSTDIQVAFEGGDHSDYQQLGTDMVKFILSNGGSNASAIDSETLQNFTNGLSQVAQNAVPNAIQSAGYVRTAAALASLTPDLGVTYDTRSLYNLVSITLSAVDRTPSTAALQQLQDLLDFYSLTPELVLASYSDGSSRTRLSPFTTGLADEILEIWLDLYEVMKEQLAYVALSRCTCGCEHELTTGTSSNQHSLRRRLEISRQGVDATPLTAAASYVNTNQTKVTQVRMKMAHYCNSEQGLSLSLRTSADAADEQISFSWCKEVYRGTMRKLYFSLAKTPDYIYLSGLHRNVTLSDGLIGTLIGEVASDNRIRGVENVADCYSVSIPIPRELSVYALNSPDDQRPAGVYFSPTKEWEDRSTESILLYQPDFSGLTTRVNNETGGQRAVVEIQSSKTGVMAVATRYAWAGVGFSLEGINILVAILGVIVGVLVLVALSFMGAYALATRGVIGLEPVVPVDADFTYLERDVYGRGTVFQVEEQDGQLSAQLSRLEREGEAVESEGDGGES